MFMFTRSRDSVVGPCPKRLKLGFDYSKEEILELFGWIANKNCYMYCFNDDEKLIKHIKELWMVYTSTFRNADHIDDQQI
jgi:hypothetical protein